MPLYGSAFPADDRVVVVTVACPNRGSYEALMRALNNITPEAYEPGPPPKLTLHAESLAVAAGEPATGGGASSQAVLADEYVMPEEPPLRACAAGGCGDE